MTEEGEAQAGHRATAEKRVCGQEGHGHERRWCGTCVRAHPTAASKAFPLRPGSSQGRHPGASLLRAPHLQPSAPAPPSPSSLPSDSQVRASGGGGDTPTRRPQCRLPPGQLSRELSTSLLPPHGTGCRKARILLAQPPNPGDHAASSVRGIEPKLLISIHACPALHPHGLPW